MQIAWIVFLVATAGLVSGCGSSDSSSESSSDGSANDAVVSEAETAVSDATARVTSGVPTSSPPAAEGKFVVLVPCSQAGEGCAQAAEGAEEAATAIGWRVQTIDGKGTANGASAAIQQAITLSPDAIITFAVDPTTVQGALKAAQDESIPVVGSSALPSPLLAFAAPREEVWGETGRILADYLIAETDGQAKVLMFGSNEFAVGILRNEAFAARMAECSDCEILTEANFTFADLASAVPQLVQQNANANPDFDSVYIPYDAAASAFLQGLRSAGVSEDKLVVSADGGSDSLKCVREGCGLDADVAFPLSWIGWQDIDVVNRIFNDADPGEAIKELPVKLIVESNAPSEPGTWGGDFDFRTAYRELWQVD